MLYAKIERKEARGGLKRRNPVLEKPIAQGRRSGSPKSFQIVASAHRTWHEQRWAGRLVMVHSACVEESKNMDCHCVSSLKMKTKAPAKDGHIGKPGNP